MNVAPQLTADEFKDVHNGKCRLYGAIQQMIGVLSPELLKQLNDGMEEMERGLKRAYEADNQAFDHAHTVLGNLQKANDHLIKVSTWSIFEVADKMHEVPYPKAEKLLYDGQEVALKPNSTWLDLWVAADLIIRQSQDLHHIFIESIDPVTGVPAEIAMGLRLTTGS